MSKKKEKQNICPTYIGGQAVLEGVMMMGRTCMATAVRDNEGKIQIEAKRIQKSKAAQTASKIPFVRGSVNLFRSLVLGTKTLMRSASVYADGEEEEGGKFSNWLAKKFKVSLMDVLSVISAVIGIALAVCLFIILPNIIVTAIGKAFPSIDGSVWSFVILGACKLVIFVFYLAIILLLKDIRRLYMYHGAEHKTINAYERGVELVPEKVQTVSRIHDRCGTSFLFIVILINIFVISVVNWALGVHHIESSILSFLAKIGIEIVLLPLIAGIGYEILKLLSKFHGKISFVFKSLGMLMQKTLTTREPDESQLEVAIAAFNKVLEMDADPTVPETSFITSGILEKELEKTKKQFAEAGIDESDAEWIYSLVLDIKRSDLNEGRTISAQDILKVKEIVDKRLSGRPLWYIIGDTEFYNCKIKVDERALIPRPETEILVDTVVKSVEAGDKVLDMCTGSGCIAVAVAKACQGKRIAVTGVDISDAAIMLANENAKINEVNVNFIVSDLFEKVRGKFNIIVSNPPYVESGVIPTLQKEVKEFEPRIALDGGEDGLDFYRRLAVEVKSHIAKEGMLILECGENQAEEILKIFKKREYAMVIKDLNGVDRFIKIVF